MDEILSRRSFLDFPNGRVVKTPPANAGDTGLIPGPGRFHMGQLSPCATTTDPGTPESRSTTREATATRSPRTATREQPQLSATRESPLEQQRLSAAKNKLNKQKC